jgi:AraC-like DNA-binding protein
MSDSTAIAAVADNDYSAVRFSSSNYAPRRRLEALREIYGRTLQRVDIEPLSNEAFYAEATLRRMPGLAMIACRRSAAIYRRRREIIDHDDVGITVGLTSGYEAHQLGRTLTMNRGDAIVMTGSEPAFLKVPRAGEYLSIRVPVASVAPCVGDLEGVYGKPIPADNPALQLLIRYIGINETTEGFAAPELRRHVVAHIHDLVALAIGAMRDAADVLECRGARAARLRAIKEDIAIHLHQGDLSLAALAARHQLLPRYIQRLFECEGTTFTEYVLTHRLAWAHRTLSDPRSAERKICAIAFDAGFSDLSYFNRTFRRRYGISPSDLRAATSGCG